MIESDRNPIPGCFLGTIGDYVVYLYRGKRCIRRKPSKVKPPSAPGQVAQQERMASIAIFYQALKEVGIYDFWRQATEGMMLHGYNLLVQRNLPAFGGDGRICDFSKLQLTAGAVALPDGLRVREEEEGVWRVEWEGTPLQANASPEDRLRLYVMKDRETFAVKAPECGDARRGDGTATFRLPEGQEAYLHLYVAFVSRNGKECSENKYFKLLETKCYGKI